MELFVAIFFTIILFLISYFSEGLEIKNVESKRQAKSFAGGIAITYLFLELIPRSIPTDGELFFLFILLGFCAFHLLEEYLYEHADGKKLKRELKEEHAVLFAGYHVLVGMLLLYFLRQNILFGVLFFIPVALQALLSSAALRNVYEPLRTKGSVKIFLALMPLLGVIITLFLPLTPRVFHMLTGVIAGSLIHLVVRDIIPKNRQGYPTFFALGVITMMGFLSLTFVA